MAPSRYTQTEEGLLDLRWRSTALIVAIIAFHMPVLAIAMTLSFLDGTFGPWYALVGAFAAIAVLGTWAIRRTRRVSLHERDGTVIADNGWRTHHAAWSDISALEVRATGTRRQGSTLFVRERSKRWAFPVSASSTASRGHAERWCRTALRRAQDHGIPFVVKDPKLRDLHLPGAVFDLPPLPNRAARTDVG